MIDSTMPRRGPGDLAAAGFVKARQFPIPELRTASAELSGGLAQRLPSEQAAIANVELLNLQADLTDAQQSAEAIDALERTYQRLVSWRHHLAVEAHHLDRRYARNPNAFVTAYGDGPESITRFGELTSDHPVEHHEASLALDDIARARYEANSSGSATTVQRLVDRQTLQNIVTLPDGRIVNGSRITLGGAQSWTRVSTRRLVPTRDAVDQDLGRQCIVTAAALAQQWLIHDAAIAQLAELLLTVQGSNAADATAVTDLPSRFADSAYLLYQAPLYLAGADDVIRVVLVITADILFTRPLVVAQDIDAQAKLRPQADLPDVDGFATWFRPTLPSTTG